MRLNKINVDIYGDTFSYCNLQYYKADPRSPVVQRQNAGLAIK